MSGGSKNSRCRWTQYCNAKSSVPYIWVQGYPEGTLDGGAKNSALGVTATVTMRRAVVTQTGSAVFDESSEDEEFTARFDLRFAG